MDQNIISENKLIPFIKKVYALSASQGLGSLHFTPGPLTDDEASALIVPAGRIAVRMDYVRGRACKMNVFRDGNTGALHFNLPWYDHTPGQEAELSQVIAESDTAIDRSPADTTGIDGSGGGA